MTTIIKELSEQTINQIAAGEVVEDPASIVKELVENGVDAGATKITVTIEGGGHQRLQVSDNGHGMGPEDAILSLKRHATSKIKEIDDLFTIASMGFRGEALASIASVAKVSLQTAQKEGIGTEVYVEGGKIESIRPYSRNEGTTVEVRQLFYNVPARRKFQKTESQSAAKVTKVCSMLSLAYPFVSFELYQQDKQILDLAKEEGEFMEALQKRIRAVLGEGFLRGALTVNVSKGPLAIKGFIASCDNHRPNRQGQYLFVNKRAVVSFPIAAAIKNAFGTRLQEGRFPMYVLHIEIEGSYVDVNVHPQKKEIRFKEESWVCKEIELQIQELLGMGRKEESSALPFALFSEESFFGGTQPAFERVEPVVYEERKEQMLLRQTWIKPLALYEEFLFVEGDSLEGYEEKLVLVDLHAAGERILFEELNEGSKGESQLLLFPIPFALNPQEEKVASSLQEKIKNMGYSLVPGRNSFLIEAVPAVLTEEEAELFLRDFIAEEGEGKTLQEKKERRLATMVARLVAKRKRHTIETAVALLQALLQSPSREFSPLGQKIITAVGKDEIRKLWFKN